MNNQTSLAPNALKLTVELDPVENLVRVIKLEASQTVNYLTRQDCKALADKLIEISKLV